MNTQIYEEASAWVVEFRCGDDVPAARRRFERWLSASPQHVRAYLELTALWEAGRGVDPGRRLDTGALIERARQERTVVAMPAPGEPRASRPSRRAGFLVAASMMLVAGVSAWFVVNRDPVYSTGVSEQRTFQLEDGSTMELNARSRVRLSFSPGERRVALESGQAMFRVARDASRPFIVDSGQTRVRVVGTQFDVHRKRSATVVTVVEGRVAVVSLPVAGGRGAAAPVELTAGEQATVKAAGIVRASIDPASTTAWAQHPLVFESAPLAEVADEFNRYHPRQLVIEGPGLEDFHISGSFAASDPATLPRFVQFLREQPGLSVHESAGRIVVTRK